MLTYMPDEVLLLNVHDLGERGGGGTSPDRISGVGYIEQNGFSDGNHTGDGLIDLCVDRSTKLF